MNATTDLLRVDAVKKSYGAIQVLHGVNMSVARGEVFAIIGPNGAGKTTMFKVMTGEVASNGGSIHFDGRDVTRMPAYERVRQGFGRTFQVARVFRDVIDHRVAAAEGAAELARIYPVPVANGFLYAKPGSAFVANAGQHRSA